MISNYNDYIKCRIMIRKLVIILIPISFCVLNGSQKIILKNEIQEYLFSTQLILHDFVRFEEELFNQNIKKSNQNKYNRLVKSSETLMKMLAKIRNDVYRSSNSKYSKKEKELIARIDRYVEKLNTAIAQLRLISTKQNKSNSYLFDEKNNDKIKLIEMKKSFTDEKKYLDGLLNEFILTNIPAAVQ